MSAYRIIAGLGNPGPRYAKTRHNAGFMLLDGLVDGSLLSKESAISCRGASWKEKFGAEISELSIAGERYVLAKPLSFMNLSGEPLSRLMQFYKFEPGQLIVVHDEIDLPFGSIRLKTGGGDGGHNGLKSIVRNVGSSDFARVRLGVGRPERKAKDETLSNSVGMFSQAKSDEARSGMQASIADWVLSKFAVAEEKVLQEMLQKGVSALEALITLGVNKAQARYN